MDLPKRVVISEEGPREGFQIEKGPIRTADDRPHRRTFMVRPHPHPDRLICQRQACLKTRWNTAVGSCVRQSSLDFLNTHASNSG